MKIEVTLDGYIPASATIIADVPDDITEDELETVQDDLFVKELQEDGTSELSNIYLGRIVSDNEDVDVRVTRKDGELFVREPVTEGGAS